MRVDYKKLYNASYDFLMNMLPDGVTENDLQKYFVSDGFHVDSLKDVFIGLIHSAQNYQFMPKVIDFNKRKDDMRKVLFDFDYKHISSIDPEELYYLLRKEFNVVSKDSHYNSWYKWSCSVVDSAKFVSGFNDFLEFDNYIKESTKSVDIPKNIKMNIRGIGFALACDALKELGYHQFVKPDVHITDICEELKISDRNQINVFNVMMDIASDCNVAPYKLDKVLWLICSGNFYNENIKVKGKKKELIIYLKSMFFNDLEKTSSWHIGISAEAFAAAQFARYGIDVSVQYGANQPEYDLIITKGDKILKVSVKGSQDGGWGLTQKYMKNRDYHGAIDDWLQAHGKKTIFCLVQFKNVNDNELPRMYLASPAEIAKALHDSRSGNGETVLREFHKWGDNALAAGSIDKIPEDWKFTKERILYLFDSIE